MVAVVICVGNSVSVGVIWSDCPALQDVRVNARSAIRTRRGMMRLGEHRGKKLQRAEPEQDEGKHGKQASQEI